ncbi:MAG: SDR family oxidoreductase [Armatimonadetes bacterium]|nr:SDR family oxidoreductase [Armatimonadota bacterium]
MIRSEGKRVVVTGAAGRIGAAICAEFQNVGAVVIAFDLKPAPSALATLPADVSLSAIDVTSRDSVEAAARAAGDVDVLVLAHGRQIRGTPMADADDAAWDAIMEVNLKGVFRCCQAFGAPIRARGGAIVAISSINGVLASKTGAVYWVSKAGVVYMTRVLALEWAPRVRVNSVAPTTVITDMSKDLANNPAFLEKKIADIPMARLAEAEDVAATVAFLASDRAGMITGQTIAVDGGLSLS